MRTGPNPDCDPDPEPDRSVISAEHVSNHGRRSPFSCCQREQEVRGISMPARTPSSALVQGISAELRSAERQLSLRPYVHMAGRILAPRTQRAGQGMHPAWRVRITHSP